MTSNTLPARDRSIDILKGFGILLMICGHIGFGTPFIQFCASFYMPLFYVVSGYLLNGRRPFGSFVLKKAKGLLVPYYAFGALGAVLAYFFRRDTFAQSMYNFFFFPTDVPMPVIGAIWFLMSLFLSENIYYLFFKLFKNKQLVAVPCIILCVLLTVVPNYFETTLPLGLNTVGISLVYIHFGFLIRYFADKNKERNVLSLRSITTVILLALHLGLCFFANGVTNYRSAETGKSILLYIFISMLAIIGYWNLFKRLKQPRMLLDYLNFAGKNSIVYLVTNQVLILAFRMFFTEYMNSDNLLLMIGSKAVCAVFVLAAEHALVYLFRLKGLRRLVGK